jgi:8-oxo-dGTP pyrophosphatase MutT (NUDIX family)
VGPVRWTVHGERPIYDSDWMRLVLVDVEIPGARRFDHHVVRYPKQAAGTVVHDPDRGVLLLWRHRFITDTWGWEVPAGRIDAGEDAPTAAAREAEEETGWRPGPLRPLCRFAVASGITDHTFSAFLADGASYVGEPTDAFEAERVEWVPLDGVRAAITAGQVPDGPTLTSLCYAFTTGAI